MTTAAIDTPRAGATTLAELAAISPDQWLEDLGRFGGQSLHGHQPSVGHGRLLHHIPIGPIANGRSVFVVAVDGRVRVFAACREINGPVDWFVFAPVAEVQTKAHGNYWSEEEIPALTLLVASATRAIAAGLEIARPDQRLKLGRWVTAPRDAWTVERERSEAFRTQALEQQRQHREALAEQEQRREEARRARLRATPEGLRQLALERLLPHLERLVEEGDL